VIYIKDVNIGANNAPDKKTYSPTINNNVWIGPGAKLFGDIKVGSHVAIGANSVVNKNVVDEVTVAGIPAKIINKNSTKNMNISASEINMLQFFKLHPQYSDYSPI
jgi:serine acetyltransferase